MSDTLPIITCHVLSPLDFIEIVHFKFIHHLKAKLNDWESENPAGETEVITIRS